MKKRLFIYFIAALTLGGFVTSCSDDDDDDPKVICPVEATVFDDPSELNLTYSGQPMYGKQVQFSPDANDGSKATLKLGGAAFAPATKDVEKSGIKTSGVIPGEQSTILPVNLVINGTVVSFEGVDESNGRKLAYKGSIDNGKMNLDLNVTLLNNDLANTSYKPLEPIVDPSMTKPVENNPILISWVAKDSIPVGSPDNKYPANQLIQMVMGMKLIDGQSAPEFIHSVLGQVTFLPDGNIQAKYKDDPKEETWKDSPLNVVTYRMNDGKLMLYVNPSQIEAIEAASKVSVNDLLPMILPVFANVLENGIPVNCEVSGEGIMKAYIDKEVLLPILNAIKPMLESKEAVDAIMGLIKSSLPDPTLGMVIEMFVRPILEALPGVIDTTTELNVGLNLEAAK